MGGLSSYTQSPLCTSLMRGQDKATGIHLIQGTFWHHYQLKPKTSPVITRSWPKAWKVTFLSLALTVSRLELQVLGSPFCLSWDSIQMALHTAIL